MPMAGEQQKDEQNLNQSPADPPPPQPDEEKPEVSLQKEATQEPDAPKEPFIIPSDWTLERVSLEMRIQLEMLQKFNPHGVIAGGSEIYLPEKVSHRNGMTYTDEQLAFNNLVDVKIPVGTILYI